MVQGQIKLSPSHVLNSIFDCLVNSIIAARNLCPLSVMLSQLKIVNGANPAALRFANASDNIPTAVLGCLSPVKSCCISALLKSNFPSVFKQ